MTGVVLSGEGLPTITSAANASLDAVSTVADAVGTIDVAVLFVGPGRVPSKERGRPLTSTSANCGRWTGLAHLLGV